MNKLTTLGKNLRKRPTDAAQLLWKYLRMKQMEGLKFRRQQQVDNYIVDFVCFESRIIIEVDGGQHAENNKDRDSCKSMKTSVFVISNPSLSVIPSECEESYPFVQGRLREESFNINNL